MSSSAGGLTQRSTRSRSRSMVRNGNGNGSSSNNAAAAAASPASGSPARAASSAASAAVSPASPSSAVYMPPWTKSKVADKSFFWYGGPGEPELSDVAHYLDSLTGSDLELRASASTVRESVAALTTTATALLDANARLKREMREMKLQSNRRWIWATLLLLAYTLGQGFVQQSLSGLAWALEKPQEFFPFLFEQIALMSNWMLLLAFPLTLLLFVHHLLKSYSMGRLSLIRTGIYLIMGVFMQVPLLYFLLQVGLAALHQLQHVPPFGEQAVALNHALCFSAWLGILFIDYALIVLHHYV